MNLLEKLGLVVVRGDQEFENVYAMHERFGLGTSRYPGHLKTATLQARIDFLQEELDELREAAKTQNLADIADALVDLVVVAKGTAVKLGLPWEDHWAEVHRANLTKMRGVTKRGMKADLAKPAGWKPPNHERVLRDAGYVREEWFSCQTFEEESARED